MTLKLGDVIDIIQFDENRRKSAVRRVRVAELRSCGDHCHIVGQNLHGKYPRDYELPLTPIDELLTARQASSTVWLPVVDDPDFDK